MAGGISGDFSPHRADTGIGRLPRSASDKADDAVMHEINKRLGLDRLMPQGLTDKDSKRLSGASLTLYMPKMPAQKPDFMARKLDSAVRRTKSVFKRAFN